MTIVEVLTTLKSTASTLDKKNIIKENKSDLLTQIFQDTYDESRKYNVKKYEVIESGFEPLSIDNEYHIFHELLNALTERKYTGNEAVELVGRVMGQFDPEECWILDGILQRNLKVGVSLDNFNDAMELKTIKKYEVALADKFFDLKPKDQDAVVTGGEYMASQKLDGCRCTIHYNPDNQEVKFISRQGKEFTTLSNLIPAVRELLRYTSTNMVLDGEVCILNEDGSESFHGLMSEVTRKNHTIERPVYKWFDMLTLDEFEGRTESKPFADRYDEMIETYYQLNQDTYNQIQLLPQMHISSWDEFDQWRKEVDENGWEGFMLRKNVPYKSGRSKDLLKVKKMQDAEYIVEDVVMGKVTYNEGGAKEYDAASSLVITHKGNKVYVGSGLSKEQRLRWYEHPEEVIGKTITVQYFEETKDKKTGAFSLRFPILKFVYENGREV
jgi:DNA ligase-1